MRTSITLTLSLALILPGLCGVAAAQAVTPIGAIQGAGERSPRAGDEVVIEGVVTAMPDASLGGWTVQDAGDSNPATSDALFVVDAGIRKIGDRVRVRGRVTEQDASRGTRTVLEASEVTALGRGRLPRAQVLDAVPVDWEPYEHMRMKIAAPLTVAGTHRVARDGELIVHFGRERLRTPTDAFAAGSEARALAAENARRMLRLDDASDVENPASVWFLPNPLPRSGSGVSKVEGVIDQGQGSYRLRLTAKPKIRRASAPRAPRVGGDLRIAGMNLENFFNGDGHGGGFPTPRGARTPAELQTQLARLVATIRGLNPDIAALMELENDGNGPDSAPAMLITALNRDGADWRFIDAGSGSGSDLIRVGIIYRASRVSPVGGPASLQDELFGRRSRPPLAQSFRAGSGPVFTVVANHFKSKGCTEATGADADQKDGQSCWNALRTEAARRLDSWLRGDPTGSGSDLAMIVGDLNAYSMEDPVRFLTSTGWRDAFADHRDIPYSYVYDAQIGRLDHALLSPALAAHLVDAAEWHSNADEPDSRGYQATPTETTPWRSSDHDPLVLGFRLRKP